MFRKPIKNLLICPICQKSGKQQILGEFTPDGSFSILRFHQNTTTIHSQSFAVQCPCGEIVYHKGAGTAGTVTW